MKIAASVILGDEQQPVGILNITRTDHTVVTVNAYESLSEPGCLVLDLDGDFPYAGDSLRIAVNDRYAVIFEEGTT